MVFVRKRGLSLLLSLVFLLSLLSMLAVPAKAASVSAQTKLPIFVYHDLTADPRRVNDTTLSVQTFAADLLWLQSHGYETVSLSQVFDFVYNGVALPERPVMITFDGGYASFQLLAYPLLEQYQMKAVVNVLGRPTEARGNGDQPSPPDSALTWGQIQSMAASGLVEFGNQSYDLYRQDGDRVGCRIRSGEDLQVYQALLYNDLSRLQQTLNIYAGSPPLVFAYPCGAVCQESLPVLKTLGFKAAFTCDAHMNALSTGDTQALYSLGRFQRDAHAGSDLFLRKTMGSI